MLNISWRFLFCKTVTLWTYSKTWCPKQDLVATNKLLCSSISWGLFFGVWEFLTKAASRSWDIFSKCCLQSLTCLISFLQNEVKFFIIVREAWSRSIVWNLFISWKLCISLRRDNTTWLSSLKCPLKSHSPFANKLKWIVK